MNAALWLLAAVLSSLACGAVALAEPSVTGAALEAPDAAREPSPAEPVLIDLNRASLSELTSLPGIGQKRAEAILAFRESHGGFHSVVQLLKIKGIGRAMLRKLRLLVTVTAADGEKAQDSALADAAPAKSGVRMRTGSTDIHRVR